MFQKLCLSFMYCHTVSKPSMFFRCSPTMKHTTDEHEILVLVLCWQAKVRYTDSCLNLEAENSEKPELLTASFLSALVINEIAGLLGLCIMIRVLRLAHHPSTLISSSRTDAKSSSRKLLFWLKKDLNQTTHTLFCASIISQSACYNDGWFCNTLGEPV